jgi:hypothetical protein
MLKEEKTSRTEDLLNLTQVLLVLFFNLAPPQYPYR